MQPQLAADQRRPLDYSFAVDPGELDTFVEGARRLEETMATHIRTFESLHLDSGVFGRLPGISKKVYRAYSDHVDEGTKAFAEGAAVLNAAGDRGAETAAAYREVERLSISDIDEVVALIELGDVKRAGRRVLKEA